MANGTQDYMPDEFVAETIRVLLADDHTVMRAGTRRILEDEPDIAVIGEAGDGYETLELAQRSTPDVVLLDIGMPKLDGLKVCQELKHRSPATRILVLTGHNNDALIRSLHRLGAEGYLPKSAGPQELIKAIRAVFHGEVAYGEDALQTVTRSEPTGNQWPTPKEQEVLAALARGRKNREVAEEMHTSVNTIEFHLRNLYAKLGASSRTDALMRAQRLGWLDTQEPPC